MAKLRYGPEQRNRTSLIQKIPLALIVSSYSLLSLAAHAGVVKITSVNDTYDPNHAQTVNVRPGDVVTFSADVLDDTNGYKAEGLPVEDFTWSANDRDGDTCSAQASSDCLNSSNFQVTDYGVSFYVPDSMSSDVTLTVTTQDSSALDSTGTATLDTVILHNSDSSTDNTSAPQQAITDPSQYSNDHLDPDYALSGQGHWVVIGGDRYWAPYTYVVDNEDEWVPYRHGYWSWDENRGHTWISYDPWGWLTDHYGIWRRHGDYGWVWRPFEDLHYEPHCVTWFDDDEHVGWYPYLAGYESGYHHDYNEGFIDGFWTGYAATRGYGSAGYHYRPGFTIVRNESFANINIFNIFERTTIVSMVRNSYSGNRYAPFPGRGKDIHEGRTFLEGRGGAVPETRTESLGHAGIFSPHALHPVPSIYHDIAETAAAHHHSPVGSVINARPGSPDGHPLFVPPSSNGRGIVAPPRVVDPSSGRSQPVPPQATHHPVPEHDNPVTSQPPHYPQQPGHQPPPVPVYDPNRPHNPPPHNPPPVNPPPHNPPPHNPPPHNPPPHNPPPHNPPPHNPPPHNPPPHNPPPHNPPPHNPPPHNPPPHNPPPVNPPPHNPPPVNPPPQNPPPHNPPPHNPPPQNPPPHNPPPHNPPPVNPPPHNPPPHNPPPVNPPPHNPPPHNPPPHNPPGPGPHHRTADVSEGVAS